MNVLDAIPGIGQILDDVITSREELEEAKLRLREVEFRAEQERAKTLRGMLSNDSLFVAGSIPSLIWLAVIVLVNNHILALYLKVQPINLPDAYWSLLSTIIVGLFGKKVIENNQWSWGDKLISPSRKQLEAAIEEGNIEPIQMVRPTPSQKPAANKEDPDYTNRRYDDLVAKYGGRSNNDRK